MRKVTMTKRDTVGEGSVVAPRELRAVSGAAVAIPDPDQRVHLQFRRFAGCPICNVHLQSVIRRHDEIADLSGDLSDGIGLSRELQDRGVRPVPYFHRDRESMLDDRPAKRA